MLERLIIDNVALISHAELEFSAGLNVLTGETGAGKSVILDCIDFALGAKAEKSMIRFGAAECSVRAEFSVSGEDVKAVLDGFDIEADDTLVIARRFTADGRGGIRLNGCPVTAAMLRRVTSLLVDVHGQSEHFFLLKESNQLRLLDGLAGEEVSSAKEKVREILSTRKQIVAELEALGGDEGARSRRMDILRYQIDEIARAELKEGEEEQLLDFRTRYRNLEKILNGLAAAKEYLGADGGCIDSLGGAERAVGALSRYGERYGALAERMENAAAELGDIADAVEEEYNSLDVDESEAERAEQRLDEIRTVEKKYGGSVKATLEFAASAQEEYDMLEGSGERSEKLRAQLEETDKQLYSACTALTNARKRAAKELETRVTGELASLDLSAARFTVSFGEYAPTDAGKATSEGLDSVRFLFSANKGEPQKPLSEIISGGEMSRFMLAVKAQLSSLGGIGTYIFDEIDAGIGGRTARVVGEKFCALAKNVQLIAVTHLAHIACFADRSFYIEKREEDGRTLSTIRALDGEERLREIARLIDGAQSELSLRHAAEMAENARLYKNSL